MADLKLYDVFDISPLRDYIMANGERRVFRRREKFCSLETPSPNIGVVISGGFAFSRPDYKGDSQIFTLAFSGELIGSYISVGPGNRSGFDAKALCDSEVVFMPVDDIIRYMDTGLPEGYRLRFNEAIATGFMMRGMSMRCDSPEMRYRRLLERVPEVAARMSKTDIASYLGITRETFARLRRRLTADGDNQEVD